MIELHIEALQTRKWFQRSGLRVGMANSAEWALRIGKLLRVTSSARQVARASRTLRNRGIGFAPVTQ
jgi:hypothetical protein